MPIHTEDMMAVLSHLADNRNLRVTVSASLKCGLAAGASATAGGLLFGPIGVAICGAAASFAAAWSTRGQFKSVARVIQEDMTPYQQHQLATSCKKMIDELRVEDIAFLLPLIMNNPTLVQALTNQVVAYVTNEMKLKIID